MTQGTTKVLIVGAGPTGLALAVKLAADGVDAILIEAQAEGANTSRAAVIHARTLEVLEPLRVCDRLIERGLVLHKMTTRDQDRELLHLDFSGLPTRYPFILMLPQNETEAVLLARLRELGGDVRRPWRLTGFEAGEDGLVATLAQGEAQQTIRADWLVGADGMHSSVRELAGVEFTGAPYPESFVLADVALAGETRAHEVQGYLSSEGMMLIAPLPHDRYRIVATLEPAPEHPDAAVIQALLDSRGPARPIRVLDVAWSSRFHVHHRLAEGFRHGRVLLAGDAAHVHSPAGGQGMNLGVRDAVGLGDVLAAACNGASDANVDDWAKERRRAAREVIAFTDRMTRVAAAQNPLVRGARDLALSAVDHLPVAQQALALDAAGLKDRPRPAA